MKDLMNTELSMTSIEIAELVGSRHDKVKQSVERLADRGVIQLPPMGKVENNQSNSPNRFADAYIFNGEQGKRDSIVVVAQLSPVFTGRMVDRWQELERKVVLLSAEERTIQRQLKVDVVALACAVAETTVTTAIKAAIEAAMVQQEKLASQRRDSDDFVVFDYPGADSEINSDNLLPVCELSVRTGLSDPACRRLIEFARVPSRKLKKLGLCADGDAFTVAACKLIGESEPPKGRIKRWQHPEFGEFMLRRAVSESDQEEKD